MSPRKRLESVQDNNLTPREAVLLWMGEAHQFDSLLDYGLWLVRQADEVYPLIRMPAQVVATVRAQNKGKTDHLLRDQFFRVQRDVLFLYHLHQQLNLRAVEDEEALRLKVTLLMERLRAIIYQMAVVDDSRLERLAWPRDPPARPRKTRPSKNDEATLEAELAAWPLQQEAVWQEIATFQEAVRLIANRYLGR